MKVAITGHTSGIGLELYNLLPGAAGFSRRTGHDIANPAAREAIWHAAQDCDVFINNAYTTEDWFAQTELLWTFWRGWRNSESEKRIVCISSWAGTVVDRFKDMEPYAVQKNTLDVACQQLTTMPLRNCRILNVKPGYVDTPALKARDVGKMRPQDLARLIVTLLQNRDYWVPEITVLPY